MNRNSNPTSNSKNSESGGRELGAPARLLIDFIDSIKLFWDRIGMWIAVSLTFALLVTAIFSLARILPIGTILVRNMTAFIIASIVLPAPAAGAYGLVLRVCNHKEFEYVDLWRGARKMLVPAMVMGLIYLLVFGIGITNVWFYFRFRNMVGGIAMLVSVYGCLFVMLMSQFHFSLLAMAFAGQFDGQSTRTPRAFISIWKRAFYLVLGDPIYSCGMLALMVIPSVLMTTLVVPFMLLWLGYVAVLQMVCTRAQLMKYGVLPRPEVLEAVSDADFRVKV